jgi:hypothetical protein
MIFWSILLGISIIGVFTLPLLRILRPEQNTGEGILLRDHLRKKIGQAKNVTLEVAKISSQKAGKHLSLAYNKSLTVIKKTKLPALVKGRGILKKKDTASSFLRDVQEHKDKVREELLNGESEGKVKE